MQIQFSNHISKRIEKSDFNREIINVRNIISNSAYNFINVKEHGRLKLVYEIVF